MSDDLVARLEAWDITDDDKAAIAAELTRLRARIEAADKLAEVLPTYGFECEAGPLTSAQPWIDFVEAINDRV